jgi:hypothetical protein
MILASRSLNFLLNLAVFTLFITPLNNQELQITKNPMEQVKLEFQMLRAKQNLISPNLTEKITITAKNCPTLYREISKIAQAFKILTPEITISKLESQKTAYKDWVIQYNRSENKLTIGKNLLDQLTMPELRNLIASEIGYDICMAGNSTGINILKAIGLNLIFTIPASIIFYSTKNILLLLSGVSALFMPYILLTPFMFPNFATKEVLQYSAITSFIIGLAYILPTLIPRLNALSFWAAIATPLVIHYLPLILPISLVISSILFCLHPIYAFIAKSYAKSHLDLALEKLPYLPNAVLLNSAIDKIETNGKCDHYKVKSKSLIKSWCKHHKIFADALTKKHLERQKLAAQIAAANELVNTNNDLEATTLDAALKQSVLAPA